MSIAVLTRAVPSPAVAVNTLHAFYTGDAPRGSKKVVTGGLITLAVAIVVFTVMWLLDIPTSWTVQVFGVPSEISALVILIAIVFWIVGNVYIQTHQVRMRQYQYAFAAFVVTIAIILSIVLHELCHGLVAEYNGYPIDHAGISWWGAFVSPNVGSYDVMSPMQQFWLALAGPASNIILGVFATIIVIIFGETLFENTVQFFGVVNIQLGKFNLIPFAFLDGGKVVDGLFRLFTDNHLIRGIGLGLAFIAYRLIHGWWKDFRTESWEDKLARL